MIEEHMSLSFEQCYEENIEYIRQYCNYKLGDHPDYAEDCVQETFRVLYEKLDSNVEIQYVRAFLMKTASNFVMNEYRQLEKDKKNVTVEAWRIELSYEQKFFQVDDETIYNLKDEIINSLSDEDRQLLEKTCKDYVNSYRTTKELALEYGCSEACIRQKIFRLRSRIKLLIKEKTKNL